MSEKEYLDSRGTYRELDRTEELEKSFIKSGDIIAKATYFLGDRSIWSVRFKNTKSFDLWLKKIASLNLESADKMHLNGINANWCSSLGEALYS